MHSNVFATEEPTGVVHFARRGFMLSSLCAAPSSYELVGYCNMTSTLCACVSYVFCMRAEHNAKKTPQGMVAGVKVVNRVIDACSMRKHWSPTRGQI